MHTREGQVRCTVQDPEAPPGAEPKEVLRLGKNNYFGEKALLMNKKRGANVIAANDVKLLSISRSAFEEVLGPLSEIIEKDREKREKRGTLRRTNHNVNAVKNIVVSGYFFVMATYSVAALPRFLL